MIHPIYLLIVAYASQVLIPILIQLMEIEIHQKIDRSTLNAIILATQLKNAISYIDIHLVIDKDKNLHKIILKAHL